MKLKIQIKSIGGSVLFEFEKEDNTVKDTLVEAVKNRANLRDADLRGAYLRDAYLTGANLGGADLRDAYLTGAYLRDANLRGAYLTGAYLRDANLRGAYLRDANLGDANLTGADLRGADLRGANLTGADLGGADLTGANLGGADLRDAYLGGAKNIPKLTIAETRILPEGDIIGYKRCGAGVIVKLLIPKEAKRSSAFGRKCRAEYAEVLEISEGDEAISYNDRDFKYHVGDTVRPTQPFDENWLEECSTGIHFYITRLEAENH